MYEDVSLKILSQYGKVGEESLKRALGERERVSGKRVEWKTEKILSESCNYELLCMDR